MREELGRDVVSSKIPETAEVAPFWWSPSDFSLTVRSLCPLIMAQNVGNRLGDQRLKKMGVCQPKVKQTQDTGLSFSSRLQIKSWLTILEVFYRNLDPHQMGYLLTTSRRGGARQVLTNIPETIPCHLTTDQSADHIPCWSHSHIFSLKAPAHNPMASSGPWVLVTYFLHMAPCNKWPFSFTTF